MLKKKSSKTMC